MSENLFMIGTKFYRHIGKTEVPDIIRLKKQENNTLYFNNGAYEATITKKELYELIFSEEFIEFETDKKFFRIFDYFGTQVKQTWELVSEIDNRIDDIDHDFVKFKVENIGLKMTVDELKKNYTRLIPDGFITISNIDYLVNEGKERGFDVLITLNKEKDTVPSVICRQDVIDVFQYHNDSSYIPIGLSISRKACPNNMDYSAFMYAENIKNFKAVAVYLDDSINTVLKYVGGLSRYNSTMQKLKQKYRNTRMMGCNDNIYDLLLKTSFPADFYDTFGVISYPFALDMSRSVMNEQETRMINSILRPESLSKMTNIVYCPYDRGIDISKIDSKFILVNTGSVAKANIFILTFELEEV